ncbi:MAG: hypothetical protein AAGA75_23045 [Cyanobacteria bacterium P01_E01_bin.6]
MSEKEKSLPWHEDLKIWQVVALVAGLIVVMALLVADGPGEDIGGAVNDCQRRDAGLYSKVFTTESRPTEKCVPSQKTALMKLILIDSENLH